ALLLRAAEWRGARREPGEQYQPEDGPEVERLGRQGHGLRQPGGEHRGHLRVRVLGRGGHQRRLLGATAHKPPGARHLRVPDQLLPRRRDLLDRSVPDRRGEVSMSQLVGTWVSGDSGKELQYYVTQSGSPLDVTGATSIVLSLVRRDAGSDAVVVISGAIISPASGGGFRWAGANAVGLYVPQPSSRLAVHIYEARVSFVLAGATYWTESFRLAVTQWGLST